MIVRILLLFIALFTFGAQAQAIKESYAFAVLGEPRYAFNFNHFDYVNPAAPKGGQITLSALGTFDNFNRYALRGNPGARTEQLYDTLFTTSDDEPGSYYPLIAESARYADDYSWVEVAINPRARFHDGSPITARDVEFTFQKFMTEGVPQFRLVYKGTTVKAIAPLTVRIELAKPGKEDMLSLFSLPVFPEKYWKDHKLSDPLATPPLASGPYRITSWKMGQNIVYSRVKDYWAANLPVNRGRWNFDTIRYDYYLDDNVAFEAFKAGAFDLRMENDAKNWATRYTGKNFDKKYIIKDEQKNESAQDTRWLAFNIQRPVFSDRRVREAITLAFDFEWMNKALFYNAWSRTNSYFQNTEYAARNYPDAAELVLLAPMKKDLPSEVFTQIYQPPVSKGDGYDRDNLLKADKLLNEAGWVLKGQQRVNATTGQPLSFELLLPASSNSQWVLPLVTEDMAGFISIADWYAQHAVSPYSDEVRQAMLKAVALAFKKMHSINRQHGCCYVRHIYVKTEGNAEAGFLDLEKSRRRLRRDKAINHDFRQLEKYLEPIPKADWEQVKAYYYAM